MVCIKCKRMVNSTYCPECGSKTNDYRCECTNALNWSQKFCEKCGRQVPPKPTLDVAKVTTT